MRDGSALLGPAGPDPLGLAGCLDLLLRHRRLVDDDGLILGLQVGLDLIGERTRARGEVRPQLLIEELRERNDRKAVLAEHFHDVALVAVELRNLLLEGLPRRRIAQHLVVELVRRPDAGLLDGANGLYGLPIVFLAIRVLRLETVHYVTS